ncbi:hypothetical protein GGR58DRAFT_507213 [Xylaria digitata]|nr:hypothetical protein GGR58DRAFT_507213 [Xylaria digitata]
MTKRLTADDIEDIREYLLHASSRNLSSVAWGSRRMNCHGEGRSSSNQTWHIGVWKQSSDGRHFSAIVSGRRGGPTAEGSTIDYGRTQPRMIHVLNEYKRMYDVPVNTPSPHDSDNDDQNGPGGGGGPGPGGKGKGRGKPWYKKVKRDEYGGYYYIGPKGEYQTCDSKGNDINYNSSSNYSKSSSSRYPSYSSSHSGYYSADPSYASYSGYSTTRTQHAPASGSVQYYKDQYGRHYYVDQDGYTQWA